MNLWHQFTQSLRERSNLQAVILLFPALFWLIFFFLIPLGFILVYSFAQRGTYGGIHWVFTLQSYRRLIDPLYLGILWRSISTGFIATAVCLLIGYPFAYYLARHQYRWRNTLLLLVVIPFWTNFLIRTYAWILILRTEGVLNTILTSIFPGASPLELLNTPAAVQIGLIYGYLPFMVLPLYASLEKLDPALIDAAKDLGASPWKAFLNVTLPLSLPGIAAGSVLVFIPTVGAFITPDLLGGGKVDYIGNVVERQFKTARDWPFGSALSFLLMGMVLIATVIYFRVLQGEEGLE